MDLSEISLNLQYLHVQVELINFRRIILKNGVFLLSFLMLIEELIVIDYDLCRNYIENF